MLWRCPLDIDAALSHLFDCFVTKLERQRRIERYTEIYHKKSASELERMRETEREREKKERETERQAERQSERLREKVTERQRQTERQRGS